MTAQCPHAIGMPSEDRSNNWLSAFARCFTGNRSPNRPIAHGVSSVITKMSETKYSGNAIMLVNTGADLSFEMTPERAKPRAQNAGAEEGDIEEQPADPDNGHCHERCDDGRSEDLAGDIDPRAQRIATHSFENAAFAFSDRGEGQIDHRGRDD